MQHSSDNLNESREQKLQKSLSNFDSTLLLYDLKQLNIYGPRDTSRFYEHRTRPLYLQHKTIHVINNDTEKYTVQHEWTDITQKYNWENLLDNMDEPIYKFEINSHK
jgi:hypothetical protein